MEIGEEHTTGFRGARSTVSKGTSAAGKVKSAAAKGKALGGKPVLSIAILFLLGLLIGSLALVNPSIPGMIPIPKAILLLSATFSLSIGIFLVVRIGRRPDGERNFWRELGVISLAGLVVAVGMILAHILLPDLVGSGSDAFVWSIVPATLVILLPLLLVWSFRAAVTFEARRYELWYYPKNYREQQHTWNRDRIVIANFHFKRKENEDIITTVNVKLPEDAELGELAYLFIKDYNENKFPNSPITGLHDDDGVVGWLFRKPRYLLRKQRKWTWTEDILDPRLTIAENRITRDCDVHFVRVYQENQVA